MWCIGVEVEQETSAPPPKKNHGSAPELRLLFLGSRVKMQTKFSHFINGETRCTDIRNLGLPQLQLMVDDWLLVFFAFDENRRNHPRQQLPQHRRWCQWVKACNQNSQFLCTILHSSCNSRSLRHDNQSSWNTATLRSQSNWYTFCYNILGLQYHHSRCPSDMSHSLIHICGYSNVHWSHTAPLVNNPDRHNSEVTRTNDCSSFHHRRMPNSCRRYSQHNLIR